MASLSSGTPSGLSSEAPNRPSVSGLPLDTLDFAARMFNLARNGEDGMLGAYLDAGLPPNLTNHQGGEFLYTDVKADGSI